MRNDDTKYWRAAELAAKIALRQPMDTEPPSREETQKTIYELCVYQIELEMQNEDLRRTQEELSVARENYFDLYNLAPIGYCTISESGVILQANLTLASLLGVNKEDLISRPLSVSFSQKDQDGFFLLTQQLFRAGTPRGCELRMLKADGSESWVRLEGTLGKGDSGGPVARLVVQDVSERKRTEAALSLERRRREADLEALFESAPLAYHETDGQGTVRRVNAAECALLGCRADEILGRPVWEILGGADRGGSRSAFFEKLEKMQTDEPTELRFLRPDGATLVFEIHDRPVFNESGEIVGLRTALLDVTARAEVTRQLRASRDRTVAALGELENQKFALDHHAIVSITDTTGAIAYANDKFCAISGYSREELLGQNHRLMNSGTHPTEFYMNLWSTITQGSVWHGEICNHAKDGTLYWVDSTIVPVLGAEGKPRAYVAIRTDVTARKRDEDQITRYTAELAHTVAALEREKNRAEAANRAKSEFLASMSHEIRTPMNGVIGMTGLLLGTALSPEQQSYAETVRTSGEALLTIINDILDFSKVEAGKMALEVGPLDLHGALEDVIELMAVKAREKQLELLLHYTPDTPRKFFGDSGRIRQVLLNLVSNAIKFTAAGQVLVEAECTAVVAGVANIRIAVHDTGIGIPADLMESLFQKFHQVDSSTTRKFGGTGLGLAISRQLVELMGGTITLTSREGEGSTFCFELPLPLRPDSEVEAAPIVPLLGVRVLVVDDFSVCRLVTKSLCAGWGMRVEEAASGEEALRKVAEATAAGDPYQIVCLDHKMPGIDGAETARRLRGEGTVGGPAIVMTTATDGRDGINFTGDARLLKPLRESVLLRTFQQLLDGGKGTVSTPERAAPVVELPRHGGRRVLVVDDNIVNQRVAMALLRKMGCLVDVAANGREGCELAALLPYDLIFMDCQMPEMDGFAATREIRKREGSNSHHTPIVALTAGAMIDDRDRCLEAGMDGYLTKPVRADHLRAVVDQYFEA
ncbi:MAG: PAS domain S-box protein [Acidobacteria bacterium]|nr:PAS domain S-box protein [Acidobacteriota bacterium]